jgi:dTDP-4-dehydrorhamnose reductase
VFSGKDGDYVEDSPHDCLDFYGKSKSLGEPNNCMTIRTSIIGPEIHKNASLVEWVRSQEGNDIKGFTNHYWNGITTKQYASTCSQIIDNDLYELGLFHVFSNKLNKYELVKLIIEKYGLNIKIDPFETDCPCDRTMSTVKDLMSKLDIPSLDKQIEDM